MFTYISYYVDRLINYYYSTTPAQPVELSQKQRNQLQSYRQSIRKATDSA